MEYSVNYHKVKSYYAESLWDKRRVTRAVGLWITPAEFQEITGDVYEPHNSKIKEEA